MLRLQKLHSQLLKPHIKLKMAGTVNRRISNIEPQNVEGWNRYALSFYKIDRSTQKLTTGRIHPFDIRHSIFIIRYSLFQSFFKIRLAAFQDSGVADTQNLETL